MKYMHVQFGLIGQEANGNGILYIYTHTHIIIYNNKGYSYYTDKIPRSFKKLTSLNKSTG